MTVAWPPSTLPYPTAAQAALDAPWVAAYERAFPQDSLADDDPRRGAIALEMRQVYAADSLDAALAVIGWWDWPEGETVRDRQVATLRRRLRASRSLQRAVAREQTPPDAGDAVTR